MCICNYSECNANVGQDRRGSTLTRVNMYQHLLHCAGDLARIWVADEVDEVESLLIYAKDHRCNVEWFVHFRLALEVDVGLDRVKGMTVLAISIVDAHVAKQCVARPSSGKKKSAFGHVAVVIDPVRFDRCGVKPEGNRNLLTGKPPLTRLAMDSFFMVGNDLAGAKEAANELQAAVSILTQRLLSLPERVKR